MVIFAFNQSEYWGDEEVFELSSGKNQRVRFEIRFNFVNFSCIILLQQETIPLQLRAGLSHLFLS